MHEKTIVVTVTVRTEPESPALSQVALDQIVAKICTGLTRAVEEQTDA